MTVVRVAGVARIAPAHAADVQHGRGRVDRERHPRLPVGDVVRVDFDDEQPVIEGRGRQRQARRGHRRRIAEDVGARRLEVAAAEAILERDVGRLRALGRAGRDLQDRVAGDRAEVDRERQDSSRPMWTLSKSMPADP
jgi:hypothetical protein